MCNSPSANYYKPTDEPEPWDLTQLNIEASVMCLVSKVKFLCGRCSSPAVRLRNKNGIDRNQTLKNCLANNRNNASAVVTMQPKNGIKSEEASKLLDSAAQGNSDIDKNSAAAKAKEGIYVGYVVHRKKVCQICVFRCKGMSTLFNFVIEKFPVECI